MTPRDKAAKEQEKAAEQAGDEAAQAVKDETGVGDRPPSDPQALREEIVENREELGDTVEALSKKADVKGQVKEKVAERKEQLRGKQEQVKAKLGMDERKEQLRGKQEQVKAKLGEARGKAKQAGEQAKERPAPIGAVAGGLAVVLVLLWLIRRR